MALEPCIFPKLNDGASNPSQWENHQVARTCVAETFRFCREQDVHPRAVIAVAWAVILRHFTDIDSPIFSVIDFNGYQNSGSSLHRIPGQGMTVNDTIRGDLTRFELANEQTGLANTGIITSENFIRPPITGRGFVEELPSSVNTLDVLLVLQAKGGQMQLLLSYRTDVLSDFFATNLLDVLTKVIYTIIQDPEQPIDQLSVLTRRDSTQISQWNNRILPETDQHMHRLISRHATSQPAMPAVEAWDGSMTFLELDEASTQVAVSLLEMGARSSVKVPVFCHKSLWAVVALLAINKTGAAFVPLDPTTPMERVRTIFRQVDAHVLVVAGDGHDLSFLDGLGNVVCVGPSLIKPEKEFIVPCLPIGMSDTAYCLPTSGSTGSPKLCVVSQAAFANIVHHSSTLHLYPGTRVLQFASMSFGVSLIEIFCSLSIGATVCMPSDTERKNALSQSITSMGIEWAFLTPSVLRTLEPSRVPTLRTLIVTGEPFPRVQISSWSDKVRLYQAYGLTEWAGAYCISDRITSPHMGKSIGGAINGKFWITRPDNANVLQPIGAVGELVIEGPSLAQGYLNDPEGTKAAFIPAPAFQAQTQGPDPRKSIVYRTGDLVRYQTDGKLTYVGRKAGQAKVRGQRVELGEVEWHLRRLFPHTVNAVAEVATPIKTTDVPCLVAFILLEGTGSEDSSAGNPILGAPTVAFLQQVHSVQQQLNDLLPSYMIPTLVLPVTCIPRTVSGKTDRRQLCGVVERLSWEEWKRYTTQPNSSTVPDSDSEKTLADMWAQVLRLSSQEIMRDDDFLKLGGDSIMAMRLVAMCRSAGLQLTIADVFSHSTLASLAQRMTDVNGGDKVEPSSQLDDETMRYCLKDIHGRGVLAEDAAVDKVVPAIGSQGLWIDSFSLDYFCFYLTGDIDFQLLEQSCRTVIERHEILRSLVTENDRGLFHVILRDVDVRLHRIMTTADLAESCEALRAEDCGRSLHLDQLVTRFFLISRSQTEHVLVLRLSHTQHDMISSPILFSEIGALYNGESPPPPTCQFSDYALHSARGLEEASKFWKNYLDGAKITRSPTPIQSLSSANDMIDIRREVVPLPVPPVGITLASLGRAAWICVLSQLTHEDDLCVGQGVSGRNMSLKGVESVVGPCLNLLPFRARIHRDWTIFEYLRYIQRECAESCRYDYIGTSHILGDCSNFATDDHFSYWCQHQDDLNMKMELDGVQNTSWVKLTKLKPTGVFLFTLARENRLSTRVLGRAAVIDPTEASLLIDGFSLAVRLLVNNLDRPLSSCTDRLRDAFED